MKPEPKPKHLHANLFASVWLEQLKSRALHCSFNALDEGGLTDDIVSGLPRPDAWYIAYTHCRPVKRG